MLYKIYREISVLCTFVTIWSEPNRSDCIVIIVVIVITSRSYRLSFFFAPRKHIKPPNRFPRGFSFGNSDITLNHVHFKNKQCNTAFVLDGSTRNTRFTSVLYRLVPIFLTPSKLLANLSDMVRSSARILSSSGQNSKTNNNSRSRRILGKIVREQIWMTAQLSHFCCRLSLVSVATDNLIG